MLKPTALYKWTCTLCGEFQRKKQVKYQPHVKMSKCVRQHIRNFHPGQHILIHLKKKKKDGKKTVLFEIF